MMIVDAEGMNTIKIYSSDGSSYTHIYTLPSPSYVYDASTPGTQYTNYRPIRLREWMVTRSALDGSAPPGLDSDTIYYVQKGDVGSDDDDPDPMFK